MEKEKLSKLIEKAVSLVMNEFVGKSGEVFQDKMTVYNISILVNRVVRMVVKEFEKL